MTRARLPRLARAILRVIPLGELRAEIEADLEQLFDARVRARGPRYAARRYYGDVFSLWRGVGPAAPLSDGRPGDRGQLFRELAQNLTYTVRLFRRSPAVVSIAIVGLGVAIGVGTSVFTLLNALAFRSVGIVQPATAVRVLRGMEDGFATSWSHLEFSRLREASTHVQIEAALPESVFFSASSGTESEEAAHPRFVSGGYLTALSDRAALGRLLSPSDDVAGAIPVAVLNHAFWRRRLGADPSIVGREIWLNGTPFMVIGVAAAGFTGTLDTAPSLWAPLAAYHLASGGPPIEQHTSPRLHVIGRLRQGLSRAQGEAALSVAAAAVGRTIPDPGGHPLTRIRFQAADGRIDRRESAAIAIVVTIAMIVILLIVLLACVNVAHLLLASAAVRQRELGVRLAVGASRGRLVRQLLTESASLGIAGGAIGLFLTLWLVPVLTRLTDAPAAIDVSPDPVVYAFLAALSIAAGVGAGLVPLKQMLRLDVTSSLKGLGGRADGSSRPGRARGKLIGLQAAASLVLLVLAALLTRGMVRASAVDIGFDATHLLTVSPAFGREMTDETGARAYWDAAVERASAVPGVVSAALSDQSPFRGSNVTIFRRAGGDYTVYHHNTQGSYFATLGLRVLRGRTFTRNEVADGAQIAVISETVARDFYPNEDPIGLTLDRVTEGSRRVIVGVVSNAITARLQELGSAAIYFPMRSAAQATLLLRTDVAPEHLIPMVRSALHTLDADVRLEIDPVSKAVDQQLAQPRMLASLAGLLAAIAVTLAVVGIYGVTAFAIGQRRQEISVRMAIGASGSDVARLLIHDSLRPVVIGLGGGLVAALLASRAIAGVLYGLSSLDPVSFGSALILLLGTASCAVVLPSRRAASLDPAILLRE